MAEFEFDLVVLGSGPGGYAAAFRAADLGLKVALIEKYNSLGGVCLNVGCIPSKALLHIAEMINANKEMQELGIDLGGKASYTREDLLKWKESVIKKLTQGLSGLASLRKVKVFQGFGTFSGETEITVAAEAESHKLKFKQAVIAVGSEPISLPFIPNDPRIFDSTGALELANPTGKMLVLGGGIIGCEMATVYNALGAEVTIVELLDQLMPGADKDIVAPCQKLMQKRGIECLTKTKVIAVDASDKKFLAVTIEAHDGSTKVIQCEQLLVSVGRKPNGKTVAAENAGVHINEHGFIDVDSLMRTNKPHIYAIGDVVGQPMLAHKATAEGRVAAEIISGKRVKFDANCIASVAYTDPEVAWVGLTENEAKEQGLDYKKSIFPWMACGRALCQARDEGLTKIIAERKTGRILGAAIVGRVAGDLIAEFALAIEMGATVEDVALTIHPHPTLAETNMLAAEMWEGSITDLMPPKEK
ncbi:MAG: dihydrolipoyl dehydrogenase [Pseudomonadota bacterium]|nr:dihydrolipoyl dehydrogenase [Pseudomonadota bacterium]